MAILTITIIAIGLVAYLATFRLIGGGSISTAMTAIAMMLLAFLPPLWFSPRIEQKTLLPLIVFAWRFAFLLPALGMATRLQADERICFAAVLLACYFVGLPLESWLLIREAKRLDT